MYFTLVIILADVMSLQLKTYVIMITLFSAATTV